MIVPLVSAMHLGRCLSPRSETRHQARRGFHTPCSASVPWTLWDLSRRIKFPTPVIIQRTFNYLQQFPAGDGKLCPRAAHCPHTTGSQLGTSPKAPSFCEETHRFAGTKNNEVLRTCVEKCLSAPRDQPGAVSTALHSSCGCRKERQWMGGERLTGVLCPQEHPGDKAALDKARVCTGTVDPGHLQMCAGQGTYRCVQVQARCPQTGPCPSCVPVRLVVILGFAGGS